MIVVAGHLRADPNSRAAYLADCQEVVRLARTAAGCLDFALSADLLDPDRTNILERWQTVADVDAFRESGPSEDQGPDPRRRHAAVRGCLHRSAVTDNRAVS